MRLISRFIQGVFLVGALMPLQLTVAQTSNNAEVVGFDQIKTILRKRCVSCHNPDELRGDLDLKDLVALQAGSASGAVVVAGNPGASMLYTTVAHLEEPVMPPNSRQIPAREQDLIRRWIEGGLAERTGAKEEGRSSASQPMMKEPTTQPPSLPELRPIRELLQAMPVTALASHPSRDLVAVAGMQQAILLDPQSGAMLGAIDTPPGDISALRFSRDGTLLMVAVGTPGLSGSVFAYDTKTYQLAWQIGDETDSILAFDLSPAGDMLAVGGPKRTVRLYRVPTGEVVSSLRKHTDWILSLRFSDDGLLLASGDRFGGLFVWNPKEAKVFHELKAHRQAVQAVAWSADSAALYSAGEDGKLCVWDLHYGKLLGEWEGESGPVQSLVRGDRSLFVGGRDGRVVRWQIGEEEERATYSAGCQIESLAATASGQTIVVGDISGRIAILDAAQLKPKDEIRLPVSQKLGEDLYVRLAQSEREYAAELMQRQQATQTAVDSPLIQAQSTMEPRLSTSASDRQTGQIAQPLAEELDHNRQLAEQLTQQLVDSNRDLSSIAALNTKLLGLLQELSATQSSLASRIEQQSALLEQLQERILRLEGSVSTSGSSSAP